MIYSHLRHLLLLSALTAYTPYTEAAASEAKNIFLEKLCEKNQTNFRAMTKTLSESDWEHLGFSIPDDNVAWNDPEVIKQWQENLITWQHESKNNTITLFMKQDKRTVVGFVAFSYHHKETDGFKGCDCWLWWMAIAPAFRSRGYGKQFLNIIKKQLAPHHRKLGVAVSKDNIKAMDFYHSCGFLDRGEWDHKMDWMEHTFKK